MLKRIQGLHVTIFACPKIVTTKKALHSINWQVLNLFTENAELALLKQLRFLTVHCVKNFAQFIPRRNEPGLLYKANHQNSNQLLIEKGGFLFKDKAQVGDMY